MWEKARIPGRRATYRKNKDDGSGHYPGEELKARNVV
jgi:hypothetical protein